MKKLIFISIFILFLVFPFSVYADFPDIESVSMEGKTLLILVMNFIKIF